MVSCPCDRSNWGDQGRRAGHEDFAHASIVDTSTTSRMDTSRSMTGIPQSVINRMAKFRVTPGRMRPFNGGVITPSLPATKIFVMPASSMNSR